MEDDADGEKQNRVLLRPWLENMLENQSIPGLEWFDEDKTMFKVPWKHRSKKDWSMRHSSVFLEWAKNTGRWSEGDPAPNFAQLKTRLRCAFNKAPDIDEMKEYHYSKGEEPYKVYRFNTRRGDAKSAFGRKSCQKTAGKQGQRSRSPLVMKYESCEEEVIEDDCALYEDMEVHSTVPTSRANVSSVGQQMGEFFKKNSMYTHSENLKHADTPFTAAGWTFGHDGNAADSQTDLRDTKSPVIPLTVEMMMSANGDSDCDADSPKKSWNRPLENNSGPLGSGFKSIKREVSSGKIHEAEPQGNRTPTTDGSSDRIHLLQMASLFVEAAERQKQEDGSVQETPTEQEATSVDSGENFTPAKHYVIIMPSSNGKELENMEQMYEENVTSGYVTPTGTEPIELTAQMEDSNLSSICKDIMTSSLELKVNSRIDSPDASLVEPRPQLRDLTELSASQEPAYESEEAVDLTKSAVLEKCAGLVKQPRNCDGSVRFQFPVTAASLENRGNRDSETRRNYAHLTDGYSGDGAYTNVEDLKTLSEHATVEQMTSYMEQLAVKARQLNEWEKRLKSWEMQLLAKEETLYWRDRCLQSEMATKANAYIPNKGAWSKELLPVHIVASSGTVSSLPLTHIRPTVSCAMATHSLPVATPHRTSATHNLPASTPNRLLATRNLPVSTPSRSAGTPNHPVASANQPVTSSHVENTTPGTSGSELKQRLAQMIIKSNRLPTLRADGSCPVAHQFAADAGQNPVQPSTTVPSYVTGEVAVSSQPFMGLPLTVTAEPYSFTAASQQPIPLASLIRPNEGRPVIVPVLGSSQPMLLVPRHLMPVAMAMQGPAIQPETRVVPRRNLEKMRDGVAPTESRQVESGKSEQSSLLATGTNLVVDTKNEATMSPAQSKELGSSLQAEVTTSVSCQEPSEPLHRKRSATSNSRCSSQTGFGSDSDTWDQNDQQEFQELHPGTSLVNGVKCGDGDVEDKLTTTLRNDTRSPNLSGKSVASDMCENILAENLNILPSIAGNEVVSKSGRDNTGAVLCRPEIKLPETVQKQLAGQGSLLDFTKWLREKTENICKEESQEGRKNTECCSQLQLCSDTSSSKEKLEHLNLLSFPPTASLKIVNSGSSVNGGVSCSDSVASKQGSRNVSPVSSPNVPLVVEHENDFLEKEGDDEDTFSATESPLNNRKQANVGGRRKRSCENRNVLKKARVDC